MLRSRALNGVHRASSTRCGAASRSMRATTPTHPWRRDPHGEVPALILRDGASRPLRMRAGLELRPLRRKGSSGACSRSRLITEPRSPFLFTCQTAHVSSFPRRVFAPGFCFLCFAHPNEGWRSAEKTLGCSGTRGACRNAARQTPCEAPCVSRRRSPLGAPPWRFWAPVPRFPHRQLSLACASASNRIGHSELLASGS